MGNKFSNTPWQIWVIILMMLAVFSSGCSTLKGEGNNKNIIAENSNLREQLEQEKKSREDTQKELQGLKIDKEAENSNLKERLEQEQKSREEALKELERLKIEKEEEAKKEVQKEEFILGKWYTEQTIEKEGTKVFFKGNFEYFPNKSSRYEGELSISGNQNFDGSFVNISVDYYVTGTQEWLMNDQKLISKEIDLKSDVRRFEVNGREIPISQIPPDKLEQIKAENLIPKGLSNSERIISLTSSKMELESDGILTTYNRR
ncbi:hypothetical protein [Mastigocoleus sp. MO_188.B34]|uniref:hypothetical protein n=1 Tax=Mastigocoleus sp. MO_188.B34 TaxID=3036635 RepID=UPI002618C37C|nr:hypothetical protein [Mastigocoleus sp. MO_188.B34]MDJ0697032.1 hypothetical protein [Mastigocoleus sp. MO_188.B34]